MPAEALRQALADWTAEHPGEAPTQQDLDQLIATTARKSAELLERTIADQLHDVNPYDSCDYETLVRRVVHSAVLYGPGIVKGPMLVKDRMARYQLDATGTVQIVDVDAFRPYFEFVPCWNYYPDMSATSFEQMEGEFQRHIQSRAQLQQLAKRGDFDGDLIRTLIARYPDGNYERHSHETLLQTLNGQARESVKETCKYELLEYWGSATAKQLRAAGLELEEDEEDEGEGRIRDDEEVRFNAWLLAGHIIKLARNPFPFGTKVFHQFVFEEDEVNLLGSGLPPIMRDSQLAVASFARMLVDNAATVCGPNVEVDLDLISASQTDHTIRPFKVWLREGGTTNQRAVNSVSFDSHIAELLNAIDRFDRFADGETFVNPMVGGDMEGVSGEALRTTGGASMIYGNAALPYKDIVRSFDRFTVSVIHALTQWNRMFHIDADKMVGDVRPIARGATSLMAKEVRAFALDNLSNTIREDERVYLRTKRLLEERLKARDLSVEDLMASDEEVRQVQEQQAQAQQQAQEQQAQMLAAQLKAINADTMKALSQAQKNLDNADVAVLKALLEALKNGTTPEQLTAVAQRVAQGRQGAAGDPATSGHGAVPPAGAGQAPVQLGQIG